MLYPYITDDNLENRQTYMYSPYCGKEFLQEYEKTRLDFMKEMENPEIITGEGAPEADFLPTDFLLTLQELKGLCRELRCSGLTPERKKKLDFFVKTFEVRKRLYDAYEGESGKPAPDSSYRHIGCYLLFSQALAAGYEASDSKSLKYLSCLLKLDDTLISAANKMNGSEKLCLAGILSRELGYVSALATEMNDKKIDSGSGLGREAKEKI